MTTRARRSLGCLGYGLLILFLLILLTIPLTLVVLAARQEIVWQRSPFDGDRLWMIQEREASGFGFSHTSPLSGDPGRQCARTDVTLWLYAGHRGLEQTAYCECFRQVNGEWQSMGNCELK